MPHPIATEHSCSSAQFAHCKVNQPGKPKTKKCPNCGSVWAVHVGTYAVVVWRGDGRYRVEDAVATYARQAAAERRAKQDENLVVRFLSVP